MAEIQHLVCVSRTSVSDGGTERSREAVENKGLKGCIHGRPKSERQVWLMDREALDQFDRRCGQGRQIEILGRGECG